MRIHIWPGTYIKSRCGSSVTQTLKGQDMWIQRAHWPASLPKTVGFPISERQGREWQRKILDACVTLCMYTNWQLYLYVYMHVSQVSLILHIIFCDFSESTFLLCPCHLSLWTFIYVLFIPVLMASCTAPIRVWNSWSYVCTTWTLWVRFPPVEATEDDHVLFMSVSFCSYPKAWILPYLYHVCPSIWKCAWGDCMNIRILCILESNTMIFWRFWNPQFTTFK